MLNFGIFRQILRKMKSIFKFLKIDFSFIVMLGLASVLGDLKLYFTFVVFLILHELTHFFVAKKLGYLAGKIRLNFFGASLEGLDDFVLSDEIKIVLAGPLFNLSVAIFCYLCFWFQPESYNYLQEVLTANLAILCFNFLPIFPLDCGRFLLALFSVHFSRAKSLKLARGISYFCVAIMFLLFVISMFVEFNFLLGFVAVNLLTLVIKSTNGTSYKRQLFAQRKYALIKKGLIERNIYVESETSKVFLFKYIDDYHFVNFIFVDKDFKRVSSMTEIELFCYFNLI